MALQVSRTDLTLVSGPGNISREDFIKAYDEAIGLPEFQPGDPILFDPTEASLVDLTYDDCRLIADHEKLRRRERGVGRCALLVRTKLDFGVSRMIQALREVAIEESQVSVFEDKGAAEAWLKADSS